MKHLYRILGIVLPPIIFVGLLALLGWIGGFWFQVVIALGYSLFETLRIRNVIKDDWHVSDGFWWFMQGLVFVFLAGTTLFLLIPISLLFAS